MFCACIVVHMDNTNLIFRLVLSLTSLTINRRTGNRRIAIRGTVEVNTARLFHAIFCLLACLSILVASLC